MRDLCSNFRGRRGVLAGTAGLLATALLPRQSFAKPLLVEVPLADGLGLVTGTGVNTLVWRGQAEPTLIIDPGSSETGPALRRLAIGNPKSESPVLINTHWHTEQTAANDLFGRSGSRIIAHENTRLWMTAPVHCPWKQRDYAPRPKAALPTETFYDNRTIVIGTRHIESGYLLQAHTDGDIYVYLAEANVLAVGDVAAGNAYPITDYCTNGWIGAMVNAQDQLLKLANETTRIVPSSGKVMSRAELQAQRDVLATVRDRLFDLVKKGYSADEMIAAKPTKEFDAQYGDPELMIRNAARGLADNARVVPGVV
jgi:cyclase